MSRIVIITGPSIPKNNYLAYKLKRTNPLLSYHIITNYQVLQNNIIDGRNYIIISNDPSSLPSTLTAEALILNTNLIS